MTMTDMMNKNSKAPRSLGLYIHVPFCRTKCLYCDFCSFVSREESEREEYVLALINEIRSRRAGGHIVDTVYFGGGTPSILTVLQIERIILAIRGSFELSHDAEITLECNPMTHLDDAEEYFSALLSLGVNRLSIGVQSAVDSELKLIGRRHSFEEAKNTFLSARRAGFDNISLDLMLALPSQTLETLKRSVLELISLAPEHISIYSLQLEEGTPLHRMREKYIFPDDDSAADMYETVVALMKDAGYSHYEISNFAKKGKESRHNSKYWSLDEYLGFGLAAHSDFAGKRSENTREMSDYLSGKYLLSEQKIGERERELEFLMLGLRTGAGISRTKFSALFNANFDQKYGKKVEKFKKMGYLCENGDRIFLNERGFEISNAILSELLDFDY